MEVSIDFLWIYRYIGGLVPVVREEVPLRPNDPLCYPLDNERTLV